MQNKTNLLASLKIALSARDFDTFSDEYLMFEIDQAIAAINRCRRFIPKEDMIKEGYGHLIHLVD